MIVWRDRQVVGVARLIRVALHSQLGRADSAARRSIRLPNLFPELCYSVSAFVFALFNPAFFLHRGPYLRTNAGHERFAMITNELF